MNHDAMVYVDTLPKLKKICAKFSSSPWLALDTEFLRETTYYPKFCLLQIADGDSAACIDPLAVDNLDPLKEILFNKHITKIFHAARQDLEIFFHIFTEVPGPVFDTQVAAPLLGYGDQIGYAALASEVLNISLSKAHSRTDWTTRPLNNEQLQYALDDVFYLEQIYQKMLARLNHLGRLDWLSEDFAALTDPQLYRNDPAEAWRRIRGSNRLTASQLGVLQTIAEWRENIAQQKNKPRNWIIKDEVIVDISRLQPKNLAAMEKIRGLPSRTLKNYGKALCRLVQTVKQCTSETGSRKTQPRKTAEQEALLDVLTAVVRLRSAENTLNPSVLATRKDLERLLVEKENTKILSGWRKNLVGDELLAVIAGDRSLTVEDGVIKINQRSISKV